MTEPISPDRRVSTGERAGFAAALKHQSGSRPEAVRRARRLINDPAYPPRAMIKSLSEFFVERLGSGN